MTLNDADRKELIRHRLSKAHETIKHVAFLIEHGMLSVAVNRIYYGMFYALSALALKNQFSTTKHGQLIGWFNKNFVKKKKVERRIGQLLRDAFDSRSIGDYDDWAEFSKEEVTALLQGMKEFIREIELLIESD